MAVNFIPVPFHEMEWKPAVYNGIPVKNLEVSDYGFIRRRTKNGIGQTTRGTPNFNRENNNRLRQFMVCCTFVEPLPNGKTHTTVNVDRIVLCTFKGDVFGQKEDVDHIDKNVLNGHVKNLRKLSHSDNMLNTNLHPPRPGTSVPVASEYRYRMLLALNCSRLVDLPSAYRSEYHRLRKCERLGLPAVPRRI